ncbi:hypothetical protein QCA50_012730 [Cerrena zonata]|uniref:Uncharacterized protein n=1 Tax=Cerrena zonata TaxID=2478898 RepID=A0AAW0FST9_9APHY
MKLPNTLSKLIDVDLEDEEIDLPNGIEKPNSLIKNAGPLKIEPKVWLANERLWGYFIFNKRRDIIMERSSRHLDNVLGPLIVAVGLMVGLIVNFIFGWRAIANQVSALSDDFYLNNPLHKDIHEFVFKLVGA